jgi:hypothetical protein
MPGAIASEVQANPELDQKKEQTQQPAQSAQSTEESKGIGHYAAKGGEAVLGVAGNVLIGTATTTSFLLFGMYALAQLNIGIVTGLLVIGAAGLVAKYLSNVCGGLGFNPMNHFKTN